MANFDVYLQRDAEAPLPDDRIAYLLGRNGAFVTHRNAVYTAAVPVAEVPKLAAVKTRAQYHLPPMPPCETARILAFFRAADERWGSEAALLITYNRATEQFVLLAPPQDVSGGHCRYAIPRVRELPRGHLRVGTIHSHSSGSAYHSDTDVHDEEHMDGVHLTVGRVDCIAVEVVASLVVGGRRFTLDPTRVLGGLQCVGEVPDPTDAQLDRLIASWATEVTAASLARLGTPDGRATVRAVFRAAVRRAAASAPARYRLALPTDTDPATCEPDPAWFSVVQPPLDLPLSAARRLVASLAGDPATAVPPEIAAVFAEPKRALSVDAELALIGLEVEDGEFPLRTVPIVRSGNRRRSHAGNGLTPPTRRGTTVQTAGSPDQPATAAGTNHGGSRP